MSKRREEYTVLLWGVFVKVTFTEHALKRLKNRASVTASDILQSLKSAESKIKKLRTKHHRFVIFDHVLKTTFMAVFDNPNNIAIITVYKNADTWIEGGPDIIMRTKRSCGDTSPYSSFFEIKNLRGRRLK
ncbi:hypothetical protein O163_11465 [Caldanaerobacter subterraneus subsp. yonseiensis KB-1]|uniref:Uncharacterized protein n=1 Tax=Caldanaerobacter subterraneus subsp. yonseiensis KB-1 TaxID=1388761 RepID=U5CMK6_CALSX|nr:hypothetical protein [Caldanaerobacter subterraneus]ERM91243.1 hypothetical protein O163_11465 [Caldanaerobacter subterraneus subsp. yonseiensis KB-1]